LVLPIPLIYGKSGSEVFYEEIDRSSGCWLQAWRFFPSRKRRLESTLASGCLCFFQFRSFTVQGTTIPTITITLPATPIIRGMGTIIAVTMVRTGGIATTEVITGVTIGRDITGGNIVDAGIADKPALI
jgi:hypothetical protein